MMSVPHTGPCGGCAPQARVKIPYEEKDPGKICGGPAGTRSLVGADTRASRLVYELIWSGSALPSTICAGRKGTGRVCREKKTRRY